MAIKTEELDQYVKLAAEGDRTAFEELYRQTYSTVYFTCLSFLKNEQDAADMTQDVYVTVLGSLPTLENHSKFLPWLNRIAVNKCKNRLKMARSIPADMEAETENQPVEENENFLPEEYITNQAKRQIVMDIMKTKLTEAQYQTVIMFYFNEFTVQEISEIMECPVGTVTYRLSTAREKIRQGVSEYENANHDKLYTYASAVPLLAGLLTAEALSLGNVQAAAADTASITNAASANNAANTSKGGTIKKMLKTPKTMIAATAAAVVIIGGIAAAVIATNHENAPSSGAQTRQEGQQASSDAETDQENPQTSSGEEEGQDITQPSSGEEAGRDITQSSSDTNEPVFWLHTADWGEEKDLTGITLFNGECTAPIHLEDFDGDEHLAPYHVIGYDSSHQSAASNNLTELFTDEKTPRSISFYTQYSYYDEEGNLVSMHSGEVASTVWQINLCNYSREEVSYRQAYENNWFFITANFGCLREFGAPESGEINYRETDADSVQAILEAMIDKYGRPSYLIASDSITSDDSFLENYERNSDVINYILVWEQEEFVITTEVWEVIFSDTGHYYNRIEELRDTGNYAMLIGSIGDFEYITRELWDSYRDEYFEDERPFEELTIYDLDDLK